jgi:C1A family cysteine protease
MGQKDQKMKRIYGWKKDNQDNRDLKYSIPAYFVRSQLVDMRSHMPHVYDQGSLGSCTYNAITALVDYSRIVRGVSPLEPTSILFGYHNELLDEDSLPDDNGAMIRTGMKGLNKYGITPERLWPYDVSKFAVTPSEAAYAEARKNLISSYRRVGQNPVALQSILAAKQPVVFGFLVPAYFESDEMRHSGNLILRPNEQFLGGHAVLIVGYCLRTQRYLVRNSWGADWGIGGYFWMPMAFVHNPRFCSDFWTLTLK